MYANNRVSGISSFLARSPQARAWIAGSPAQPNVVGEARFYQTPLGVLVQIEASGLPTPRKRCESPVFALHIHEGGACRGNAEDAFADAGTHYNPYACPHPHHAGDLPPLFGANGRALLITLTDRFTLREIIGKTIIIHSAPDDFTTQPAGNAGAKIVCGVITATER